MQSRVVYIGFYEDENGKTRRFSNIAAMRKMDYVMNALIKADLSVQFISPSWITKSLSLQLTKKCRYHDKLNFIYLPSINLLGKYTMGLTKFISLFSLFVWLLIHIKRKEKVLVYHSYYLSLPLRIIKAIKKINIVLEIGEIYHEVWDLKSKYNRWENKLLEATSHYMPASKLLGRQLKGNILSYYHGNYATTDTIINFSGKNKNVVYVGSIDEVKSGAFNAVELATFLPGEYTIHIAGYGVEDEINRLKTRISDINKQKKYEACIFHGVLSGERLTSLLSKCHIAINPQRIGAYMDSAFPTKLLTYFSHGLIVLSTKIRSIVDSEFNEAIIFIDSESPEEIAEKIKSINFNRSYDARPILERLDAQFISKLKQFFIEN
ncbi:MAG: glycosyltransferase [Bacteroidales bacterium]|nr:glycosyltransferase [Bacteroidales bacterium]